MCTNKDIIIIIYNSIQHTSIDYICVATSTKELCESRDSEYTNFFDQNESRKRIDFLCITYTNEFYLFGMYLLRLYLSALFPVLFPTQCIFMYLF